eukprot:Gb_18714 [translate_table: standard]
MMICAMHMLANNVVSEAEPASLYKLLKILVPENVFVNRMTPCQAWANRSLIVVHVAVGWDRSNPCANYDCSDIFCRRLLWIIFGPAPCYSCTTLLLLRAKRVGP